jgi:hypothetical protein
VQHWEVLIIPLIAFGAWILSTIFKDNEADKNKARSRRPDGGASVRVPRRPQAAQQAARPEPQRRRDMPAEMETQKERPRPAPPLQPIITPRRPAAPRPAGQRRPPVLATVIEELAPIIRQPVVIDLPLEPPPVTEPAALAPPPAPKVKPVVPASPVMQEVVRLLRTPKTAAAALVMREILDRPTWPRRR